MSKSDINVWSNAAKSLIDDEINKLSKEIGIRLFYDQSDLNATREFYDILYDEWMKKHGLWEDYTKSKELIRKMEEYRKLQSELYQEENKLTRNMAKKISGNDCCETIDYLVRNSINTDREFVLAVIAQKFGKIGERIVMLINLKANLHSKLLWSTASEIKNTLIKLLAEVGISV